MTGFGRAEGSFGDVRVAIDIKSVNSRYLDFKLHMGREWIELEPLMKKEIEARLTRGRVDVFVDLQTTAPDLLVLNEGFVRSYLAAAAQLRDWGVQGELGLSSLVQLPGVLSKGTVSVEKIREPVLETFRRALDELAKARGAEGKALEQDITDRLARFASLVEVFESEAGRIREYYEDRLRKQIDRMAAQYEFDESRLAQEIFYYVERSDVAEEIRRLQSHLQR
ncbi:MAG: YicC/YloC family endoribonuclease, partial [Acidobacteriota bacterium]